MKTFRQSLIKFLRRTKQENKNIEKKYLEGILKHNQDDMTGLYDYDGIAQDVIDLVKEGGQHIS